MAETEPAPAAPDQWHQLLTVQEHDTALDQLRHRLAHLPERAEIAAVQADQTRTRARRAALDAEHGELAGRQSHLEKEVADLERRRAELQRKLSAGTVPKELASLAHEVDATTTRIRSLEDTEIELMEAIEPLDTERRQLDDAERAATERVDLLRVDLARAVESLTADTSREQAARDEAAAVVPADVLGRYDALRTRLGGVAVARLVGGRCTGCNLSLPTSEVDRIRHEAPDVLVLCDQCGRILVR